MILIWGAGEVVRLLSEFLGGSRTIVDYDASTGTVRFAFLSFFFFLLVPA